jgi:6-phosphogluconolactonase (cycloisomerase 2 family)
LAALALSSCADAPAAPDFSRTPLAAALGQVDGSTQTGAVYALSNDPAGNGVIAFRRAADGTLSSLGTFATQGRGTGGTIDPLLSQFALVLSADHEALFAVNAASDEVSSFQVNDDGTLAFASKVSSGGDLPVSLAVHGTLLYALNAGDNSLQGFRVTAQARLVALPFAATILAPGAAGPAAVRFTPDGRFLIVSERVSNRLEVFAVQANGGLGAPVVSPAPGGSSFGFDITSRNQPIVSETQGSLTSYALAADGALTPITASISTDGAAACWVTITADGRFAYTTNSASNAVAGFAVDAAGRLTAITPGVATGESGAGALPIDLDHVGTRLLYTLEAGTGTIGTFIINDDGTLVARPDTPAGAPASGLQGIAAF